MVRIVSLLLFVPLFAKSQCIVVVESTQDYDVAIELTITGIEAPESCPYGYNFNIKYDYDVTFSGPDAPGSLYTLQGRIGCEDHPSNFFNLPNSGGTGSNTTTSNPWHSNDDCATATKESLGCDAVFIEINGPGIPNQTVECSFATTLPVNLTSFTTTPLDQRVVLNWVTASEQENNFFTLEHSTDGKNWDFLTNISGSGNSNIENTYEYIHDRPVNGTNYYRLKQTDFNGDSYYLEVISTEIHQTAIHAIQLYPNPASDVVTISGPADLLHTVELYDATGQKIIIDLKIKDLHTATFNVTDLNPGFYLVKTKYETLKLVIN